MDQAKRLLKRRPSYEPLHDDSENASNGVEASSKPLSGSNTSYSNIEYGIYLLLGIAMLWAWNMFLAAAPYFQRRFRTSHTLLANFQAAEVSISTVANLGAMLILTKLQRNANYPRRIILSLLINIGSFTLLALSTKTFRDVSAMGYFTFAMVMVFVSSTATGFMQNGAFSYAAGTGCPEYLQAIMTGQAIAGVLPPIVQISSVLSVNEAEGEAGQQSSTSALVYFLAATGVAGITLLAFLGLLRRHHRHAQLQHVGPAPSGNPLTGDCDNLDHSTSRSSGKSAISATKSVPFRRLWSRLSVISSAVFLTFAVTMVFPVFTQEILSTNPTSSPLYRPAAFIPLAFLIWNIGDLIGRLVPLISRLNLAGRPRILLTLAVIRIIWIPLYALCNVQSSSVDPGFVDYVVKPTVSSDTFYLLIVQLPFGLTNGYVGSCCMMGAAALVEEDEREAAGSFMGLMLVSGLAVGGLCSFFVGNA